MIEGHIREKIVFDARDPEMAPEKGAAVAVGWGDLVIGVVRLFGGRGRIVIGPAEASWYNDTW